MSIGTQEGWHEGPAPGRSKYPPAVQVLGYLLGTIWFAFLAVSGDERPGWLRAAYAVVALTFAVGAAATAVKHFRERRRGGSTVH
ncbi:hypothetical protein ACFWA6_23810 [Streptomyces sp. NPDC060020]|uniref:hypothetical protein n=1 Tax=Streptomyces sp. NPDC060020 TaxID=3347038 RepID=UPI00369BAB65